MACNLPWFVPPEWQELPREEKIERIKVQLREEMDRSTVDASAIRKFLGMLAESTSKGWRNRFITTNWDYLLQREILSLNLEVQPPWMANSHVFHLNGTVEELEDNSNRSPFLLEEDPTSERWSSPEADIVYNQMLWDRTFVVVGMSFECDTDKFLLTALSRAKDDLPIGESQWVVVNRNKSVLDRSADRIATALPRATIKKACSGFQEWLDSEMKEVQQWGAITF